MGIIRISLEERHVEENRRRTTKGHYFLMARLYDHRFYQLVSVIRE